MIPVPQSKAFIIAQALCDRINTAHSTLGTRAGFEDVKSLEKIGAFVDQQANLDSEIEKCIAQAKGVAIAVLYMGFQITGSNAATHPNTKRTYLVSAYGMPILLTGQFPVDVVLEAGAKALHCWEPAGTAGISEINVKDGKARPDDDWLVYDMEVIVESKL